jgi:hypothetical protein
MRKNAMNRQQWQQKREHYAESANIPLAASVVTLTVANSGHADEEAISRCEQATISHVHQAFASLRASESRH